MNVFKCFIDNKERLGSLTKLFETASLEFLLNDYHQLPKDFVIHLVDKSTINSSKREFHSFIRANCWVLINDGAESIYSEIYKTAIHEVSWNHLLKHCEKELLMVFDKCLNINKLFQISPTKDYIEIEKLDNSLGLFKTNSIYFFTVIDKNTYMYFRTEEGILKKMPIHNSLSFLENKLSKNIFIRTHKNYLINANQLNDKLDLDSTEIKFGDQLTAKLSKQKKKGFIEFLENL